LAAKILSGETVSVEMREEMRREVKILKDEHDLTPGLAVVLVGDDPASATYVRNKKRACRDVGIHSVENKFETDLSEDALLGVVKELNADETIHGILVQLPLPDHIDENKVLNTITPSKDVDGLHPVNLGKLQRGEDGFLPCTPHGVQQILLRSNIEIEGKHVVIVGRSTLVSKPLAGILIQKNPSANATVTLCHTGTKDIAAHTRQADILVVAAGRPNTITADMVTEGSVVIDVGINGVPDKTKKRGYRLVGDVDFDSVSKKASAITPVPGGIGPMTITMLLHNTIWSAKRTIGLM
jgi:methylenetetrahydrofolate dehydrogenase (NADP+)/methenyltetrahydrofolate cyclohydrolase